MLAVIDFFITHYNKIEAYLDLSFNNFLVILTICTHIMKTEKKPSLYNRRTICDLFKEKLDEKCSLQCTLKTKLHIETATVRLNNNIREAAWFVASNTKLSKKKK